MATNNVILTPKVMAGLVLMSLGNRLHVAQNMSKAITKEFAKPSYKVGDTVQVRKPYRFAGGEGMDFDPEPLVDQVTPITVSTIKHVHFAWELPQYTLDIREAMELYADPAGEALANQWNAAAATHAADNALNSVGTPGSVPTGMSTYLAAGDVLTELGLPDDQNLSLVVNRRMSSAYVSGTQGLFNPAGTIGAQYSKGKMQDAFDYKVYLDQTINTHTNGTWTTVGLVNAASQAADGGNNATMTLNTDGWTSGGTSLKKGDRFVLGSDTSATVGGVESVHPQTRKTTQRQQVFTVQNDISDTTGTVNMVVAPAITPSGQYQNVNISPVDNAIITMIGSSGAVATQGLLLHKNAFAFVSVPLAEPPSGTGVKTTRITDPDTGLSILYTQFTTGQNMVTGHRFDTLGAIGNMYREMAVVIQA